jgi:hypothetical protein
LISFEEKKSAAPGKTLPFYFTVAVEILISNFKGNIDAIPASIPPMVARNRAFLYGIFIGHRLSDAGQTRG